jgi:hypothetical protein
VSSEPSQASIIWKKSVKGNRELIFLNLRRVEEYFSEALPREKSSAVVLTSLPGKIRETSSSSSFIDSQNRLRPTIFPL